MTVFDNCNEISTLNLSQAFYLLLENDYRYVNERNAETVEFFFHKNQILR